MKFCPSNAMGKRIIRRVPYRTNVGLIDYYYDDTFKVFGIGWFGFDLGWKGLAYANKSIAYVHNRQIILLLNKFYEWMFFFMVWGDKEKLSQMIEAEIEEGSQFFKEMDKRFSDEVRSVDGSEEDDEELSEADFDFINDEKEDEKEESEKEEEALDTDSENDEKEGEVEMKKMAKKRKLRERHFWDKDEEEGLEKFLKKLKK